MLIKFAVTNYRGSQKRLKGILPMHGSTYCILQTD